MNITSETITPEITNDTIDKIQEERKRDMEAILSPMEITQKGQQAINKLVLDELIKTKKYGLESRAIIIGLIILNTILLVQVVT